MSRLDLGYLLLVILIASVAGAFWYLSYNSKAQTWKRDVRKRRKARTKADSTAAE
jgi:hypothetical protein